jgi:hypothetical protein
MAFSAQGSSLTGRLIRNATITATVSPAQFVRTVGSFITDGFLVGMTFTTNAPGNTNTTFTITAVTATTITVTPAPAAINTATAATFTLSALIGELTNFTGPGGQANEIDVTHLGSTAREFVMGLKDSGTVTAELQFKPGDVGQVFLRKRQEVLSVPTAFVLKLSDTANTELTFNAFVQNFSISGAVDDKVTASVTLRVTGDVTWSDMT